MAAKFVAEASELLSVQSAGAPHMSVEGSETAKSDAKLLDDEEPFP